MHRTNIVIQLTVLLLSFAVLPISSVAQSQSAPEYKILVLRMLVNGERHQVLEARVVPSPVALSLGPSNNDTLTFVATDAKGKLIFSGGMEDPTIVRSPLGLRGEPERGHQTMTRSGVQYLLRLPYQSSMKLIYVGKGEMSFKANSTSREKIIAIVQSPTVTRVDLDEWLPVVLNPGTGHD